MANALKALGVRNLRSLRSVIPSIRLAPITVLLGKNSVGKSTFARVFPLLRQSAERKKQSPVLWFGDLVDFGSFRRAVTEGETDITLVFDLEVMLPVRRGSFGPWNLSKKTETVSATVWLTLAEDPASLTGYAKKVSVEILGSKIELTPPSSPSLMTSIFVDGREYAPPTKDHGTVAFQGDILPVIYFYTQQKDAAGTESWVSARNHWEDHPTEVVRQMVHQNTSTTTCRKIARLVPLGTVSQIKEALLLIPGPISWTTLVQSDDMRQHVAGKLHQVLVLSHVGELLQQVDSALSSYFKGVRYLKPLRATAERYYRRLDLSVSEIDPDGSNFPIFLDSLTPYELTKFRTWLKELLGIDVYPQREGDQVMVMAQGKNDGKAFNIADMGFGISQVLPIAAQLWATTRQLPQTGSASIVVLEQPELHLHPDSQARLADVFAGSIGKGDATKSTSAPTLLVETHSQHLVNRLGQLIEQRRLLATDVSVILFESSDSIPPSTTVRVAEFTDEGVLKNWPYGFFEPEID